MNSKIGKLNCFPLHQQQDILQPLQNVTLNPSKYSELSQLMPFVSRLEFTEEVPFVPQPTSLRIDTTRLPAEWTEPQSPPDEYYMYYLWANLHGINAIRRIKKLSILLKN